MVGNALLTKILGGVALAGTSVGGIYLISDQIKHKKSIFDSGLIDFLKAKGKIKFAVVNDSDNDLTTFPEITGTTSIIAKVKLSVNGTTTEENKDGKLTDAANAQDGSSGKVEYLKKLNGNGGGRTWTWLCEFEFKKEGSDADVKDFAEKDKLIKENNGFFNKLKDDNESNNDLKIKFIEKCASARGMDKNKELNASAKDGTENLEVKGKEKIVFSLRKGDTKKSEDNKKLYPVNQGYFDYWFKVSDK